MTLSFAVQDPRPAPGPPAVGADLAGAYRRVSDSYLTIEVGPAPAPVDGGALWLGVDLATAEGFDQAARRHGEQLEREHGRTPRRYLAPTLVLDEYAWCVAVALAGPYLAGRLLVEPEPLGVDVLRAQGRCRVRVRPGRVVTVPADAPAGTAARALTDTFHRLVEPVVEQAVRASGRRTSAMWRAAADMIAVGAWSAGEALADERSGAELGGVLLAAARAPMSARAGFRTVQVDGGPVLTRARTECCFFYTLTDRCCTTCPRIDDAERARRLAERP